MKHHLRLFCRVRIGPGCMELEREVDLGFAPYPGLVLVFNAGEYDDIQVVLAEAHESYCPRYHIQEHNCFRCSSLFCIKKYRIELIIMFLLYVYILLILSFERYSHYCCSF